MPLFDCVKCGHVENTAMAPWYGMDGIQECSQCHEGAWHGMFERFVRNGIAAESTTATPAPPTTDVKGQENESGD